jgi:hypothetical protein
MKKHSSYITHLDISEDSRYMRSTCGGNFFIINLLKIRILELK